MTTTLITSTSLTSGISHTFAADGDNLILIEGRYWGSSDSEAIASTSRNDLNITLDGTLISQDYFLLSGADLIMDIGADGGFISYEDRAGFAGINFGGLRASLHNAGDFDVSRNTAIMLERNDASVFNSGTITGATGILNKTGASNALIENTGTIHATAYDDDTNSTTFNNAITLSGIGSTVINQAGGTISAMGTEGAGVRATANDTAVYNHGSISSANHFGVDFSSMISSRSGELHNTGTIYGKDGAFDGGAGTDTLTNAGTLFGKVELNAGDDIYIASGDGIATGEIDGGTGDDYLYGAIADDKIRGGSDHDRIAGKGGDDTLRGDSGLDMIFGGAGDDSIDGGLDADTIRGGAGDDEIIGGRRDDVMRGGEGADVFIYTSSKDSTMNLSDVIQDFEVGIDHIHLADIKSNFEFLGSSAFSGTANEVRFEIAGNGKTKIEVDVDKDGSADMLIWLGQIGAVTEDDFLL